MLWSEYLQQYKLIKHFYELPTSAAGWVLRFTVAPCLYASQVHLYTDYPAPNTLYCRGKTRELQWTYTTRMAQWDPDRYVDILLDCAGPYQFRYTTGSNPEKEEGCV